MLQIVLTDCKSSFNSRILVCAPLQGHGNEIWLLGVVLEEIVQETATGRRARSVDDGINGGKGGEA